VLLSHPEHPVAIRPQTRIHPDKRLKSKKKNETPNYIIIRAHLHLLCGGKSLGSRRRSWAHRGRPRRRAVPIIITMRVRTEALKTLKSITAVEYTLRTTV